MGYSHLLATKAALANSRAAYGVPRDVHIANSHKGDIALQRHTNPNVVFFPLMAILEGGIRFPVDPLILNTRRSDYYLKAMDVRVRLISCLLNSNKNLAGEFVWVSGNWHVDELPCPLSQWDVGWYRALLLL